MAFTHKKPQPLWCLCIAVCAWLFLVTLKRLISSIYLPQCLHYRTHACCGGLIWLFSLSMQMVATSSALWTDEQPVPVPFTSQHLWHVLVLKVYLNIRPWVIFLTTFWQFGKKRGRKKLAFQKVLWKKGEKCRHCRSNILFATAVAGKQTGSRFVLITGKWVRPEDDDHITLITCDVIGDVLQC